MSAIFAILLLLAIVFAVVIIIQRAMRGKDGGGGGGHDVVAYLVLALAMGVAGFALERLASAAFPGDTFVFEPAERVATSLAALVVSVPFLVYFWTRQSKRRVAYPAAAGWTVYLSLMELVFTIAFVVAAVRLVSGLFDDGITSTWTGVVVFGAIAVFHESQARATPPMSEAGELRRVIGSAIGLITATIGAIGTIAWLLELFFDSMGVSVTSYELHPWLAMLIVGAPIWWYRWWRTWGEEPSVPRRTWTVIVSIAAMAVAIGATTSVAVMAVKDLFDEFPIDRFTSVHLALALVIVALPVWLVHRRLLGAEHRDEILAYLYVLAAAGLATSVGMAAALTIAGFNNRLIVGGGASDVSAYATILVAALATWLVFERRAGAVERAVAGIPPWPKRIYTLGAGVVFGLVATGSLITVIFILLRRALTGSGSGSILEPGAIFVYSGLAAFYLLRTYARTRAQLPAPDVVAPFAVTLICSHPGAIATKFHEQAKLRVLHRGDEEGIVSDEMADRIVAAVDNRPSYVWVDADGFRVAPMRAAD